MKDLNLQALSAHVVAWHNRHPLARRITAAHVQSVGYVVLPYQGAAAAQAAPVPVPVPVSATATAAGAADPHGGATLRERAMARAQGTPDAAEATETAAASPPAAAAPPPAPARDTLTPAFTEDFIAPLKPSAVGRWAADHGVALTPARTDAPVRQVAPSGPLDITRLQPLWVLTAQLEVGRARMRVLVGAAEEGQPPAVLGRRLWSPVRLGSLAALPMLLAALLAGALPGLRRAAPAPTVTPPPMAAASAAVVAAAASSAASAMAAPPAAPPAALPAALPAAAAASAAEGAAAPAAARPIDVEPTLGRVTLPPIGPRADERRRAADQAREQALPASGATNAAKTAAAAAAAPSPPTRSPPPTASTGTAFAVSTRVLRTRSESEQVAAAMRALLVAPGAPQMHVDVMPAGEDWRVVGWPYADRALAEKARAMLAARGMKVQVIDF